MVLFEAYGSIDMFAFRLVAIGSFFANTKKIPYLTLKTQGHGYDENRQKYIQIIYRLGLY